MAVRIRKDRKTIVCAAASLRLPGDCYLDDDVHYTLSVDLGVLNHIGVDENGADLWAFAVLLEEKVKSLNDER
ncbi:hypothetical protein LCGC14_1113090 [marine sediment metagenome]|uniref:Uncharacterized protein n=1 Tax=marine sediment metagenome TaxID=412755 RepID=A0A0F9QC85_9ZZZZ